MSTEERENKKEEEVSSKRVIYVELDDEITNIFDKIKKISAKNIYVVAPERAQIFQSIVNLKILKRKTEALEKKLHFVTNDQNGLYLAQKVGIPVYDRVAEDKPSFFSHEDKDEKLKITPLAASVNAIDENSPTRMIERKISISELLRKKRGRGDHVVVKKIDNGAKQQKQKEKAKFVLVAPNRQALIAFSVLSVFVLLVIAYIALPGATVYLTPSASVLEKSVNITLADAQRNAAELDTRPANTIADYPISVVAKITSTYQATGKKFSDNGANAKGKITITNVSNRPWTFIPETRFQTDDGLVFRIKTGVNVPAASSSGPSKVESFVVADQLDATGTVIGERGNIGPSHFFLPGLREDSRSNVYADSTEPMAGGITDFTEYVSAEDVQAAEARMRDELHKVALDDLKAAVEAKNAEAKDTGAEYVLLEGNEAVKIAEPKISDLKQFEGKEIKQFELSGEVSASGVYYNKSDMLEILRSELLLKKSPRKELVRVNDDSSSYRIFEWDNQRGKIKLTANIKGIEQFTIDENKEAGRNLLEKIRDHITGLSVDEAKNYVQNLPEINKVEIDSWPFWAPTIPKISDNIKFEIRDAAIVK